MHKNEELVLDESLSGILCRYMVTCPCVSKKLSKCNTASHLV